jgi:hypothetical protein
VKCAVAEIVMNSRWILTVTLSVTGVRPAPWAWNEKLSPTPASEIPNTFTDTLALPLRSK